MPLVDASQEPEVNLAQAHAHGLTDEEWERILKILGRVPTFTELGVFSLMWSEHCSYKSSRVHLKKLPTDAPWVRQGPGENAGAVDIGGGCAAVFKMESHNHPSFIEPYQGAATGVGGILRDVFTMNARPIASLNSLRFGDPAHPRTAYLVAGVVAGIGGYGNCMGVPTVGGEVSFDSSYNGNILVNAFTLGIARSDKIFRAKAQGVGNPVFYVGSKTGRDGIHGASLLASSEFDEKSEEMRPTVQVGDPFTEKILLESCIEAMASGAVVSIQDMGAAGLTSSSVEMAERGGCGIELDLDAVPRRETGMTPYELMLSESQERMLLVVRKGREEEILKIYKKWDLDAVMIGRVTDDGLLTVRENKKTAARIPVRALTDEAPVYERPVKRPAGLDAAQALDVSGVPQPESFGAALRELLASPNLASKHWVWRQYDSMVRTNTVLGPGADAAVVRVKENGKTLAMTVDGKNRFCALDPRLGARHAVAEAARNRACVGARPLGVTDCLNFGSPEKPEIMWQFQECVEGLAEACRALGVPVVSGNVSFYNETATGDGKSAAIDPTPTIAMVGILDGPAKHAAPWFKDEGDVVYLLGETREELGGSEYLFTLHKKKAGKPPALDLAFEKRLQSTVRAAVAEGILKSAHDCSEGGLAVALAECCFHPEGPRGAEIALASQGVRRDALLFGESASRIIVTVGAIHESPLQKMTREHDVPCTRLGAVGGGNLRVTVDGETVLDEAAAALHKAWSEGFEQAVFGKVE